MCRFDVLSPVVAENLRLTPADRGEWLAPVGFTALILLTYVVGLAIGTVINGELTLPQVVYQPILYPGLFTVAPVVLGAANTFRGASLVSTIAVGVAPGLAFLLIVWGAELTGVSSGGDALALVLAATFAAVGIGGALFGTGVVVAVRIVQERMEAGN